MERSKGIAFCGLACAVCSDNNSCAGCRNDGCTDREWCKNRSCCKAQGLYGCWECTDFPCKGTILDKTRVRAFALFAKNYGVETLLGRLEENERSGIRYHHPGELVGDYDAAVTEEGIIEMIRTGKWQN